MEVEVTPVNLLATPDLDQSTCTSLVFSFPPITQAALIEVHYGCLHYSMT
jgi:hypothetical protein